MVGCNELFKERKGIDMKIIYIENSEDWGFFDTEAPIIALKYGEIGYYPIYSSASLLDLNGGEISPKIVEAAIYGSVFGWDTPIAKPAVQYFDSLPERATL